MSRREGRSRVRVKRRISSVERGRLAEQFAAAYLSQKGYRLLAENQRTPSGELDLIFSRGESLVVVEVKARGSNRFGSAVEAIGPQKLGRLRSAVGWWLGTENRRWGSVRFDAVVVDLDGQGLPLALRHYRDLYDDGGS